MRSVPEWIGKNDDQPAPPRVKARIAERYGRQCAHCGTALGGGVLFAMDHIEALANGGSNSEGNLQPLCLPCHAVKTKRDVALKSKVARIRLKHLGIKPRKRPMPGSRASNWKRRMDGTIERRT